MPAFVLLLDMSLSLQGKMCTEGQMNGTESLLINCIPLYTVSNRSQNVFHRHEYFIANLRTDVIILDYTLQFLWMIFQSCHCNINVNFLISM
jgi:hypothetical protein